MKNQSRYSVAVRKPDGEIEVHTDEYEGIAGGRHWAKLPLIRGVVNFIDSLVLGMQTLTFSAGFYDDDEDQEPGKFEEFLQKAFGEKAEKVVMGCTVAFSIVMAVAIFMLLPFFISDFFSKVCAFRYSSGCAGGCDPAGNFCALCGADLFDEGYTQSIHVSWGGTQKHQLY